MNILIKNGTIVTSTKSIKADIFVKNGKIDQIEKGLITNKSADKIINADGYYIFPGGIDPHVHMHLPTPAGYSSDDFFSGSRAALYGGTTTLLDFVTPRKGQPLREALEQRKREALLSLVDYSFHVSPVEWRDTMAEEIKSCVVEEGIGSFKVYMAYKETIGLNDENLFKVMTAVGKAGGIVMAHCELGDEIEKIRDSFAGENKIEPKYHPLSRPPNLESEAVKKAIKLAKATNCPLYVVHVSTKESLLHISEAQKRGQKVYAETCPQYLLLNDSMYEGSFRQASPYVMSPPLRKSDDNEALWDGIIDGTIQTIGTDHCPFMLEQKMAGTGDFRKIPNGAGGIEHRLALLYSYGVLKNRISINRFVDIISTKPAKIFGLYPSKGEIAIGSDADLVIWNPEKENTISAKSHHQNCDTNIYEGFKTTGAPEYVMVNGMIALEEGKLITTPITGKFLKTC
ncbi:MAG: dihydropyrimidinase [Bacteroidales bacterium]|nr:dihydropyrimidinase [Bacteroidales bacterium]